MNFYICNNSLFDNRTFDCLMISSVDRAIQNFRSISELLEAFCNAIKTHKSLYTKKNIAQRYFEEQYYHNRFKKSKWLYEHVDWWKSCQEDR